MNWFTRVLNVFKKTPSVESPTVSEPTTPVDSVDGSTTSRFQASSRSRRRRWRNLAARHPNVHLEAHERYGLLTGSYKKGPKGGTVVCTCMACRKTFETWEKGREHACKHEKDFRKTTGRYVPRPNDPKKDRPSSPATGSVSDRPRVVQDGVGVVEKDGRPASGHGRNYRSPKRKPRGTADKGTE